jgi:hypothetical protein
MDNKNSFLFKCYCGCGIIEFEKLDWEDSKERCLNISYYGSVFYEKQGGVLWTIWHRIKFAWSILLGKEFRLYDVIVDDKELVAFKEFINGQ